MKRLSWLLILLLLAAACGSDEEAEESTPLPTEESASEAVPFVIGDIAEAPDDVIRYLSPSANYMAAQMSDFGYTIGEVKVATDMETMSEWIKNGEVDLYFDSAFPILIARNESGGVPILRRWSRGVSEYHTVFFALASSQIDTLADLEGKIIAFDTPQSTSGYLLPAAYLIENGLTPVEKATEDEAVAEGEVGYLFSYDDKNTMQWVISGKVAAGVTDNVSFADLPAETRDQIIILGETEAVPRQMAMVAPDLDEAQVAAIKAILMALDESDEGKVILEGLRTSQFDEFPEGLDAALERMQELYDLVEGN